MAYVPWSLGTKNTLTDFPFTWENGLGQSFAAVSETPFPFSQPLLKSIVYIKVVVFF